MYACFLNAIAIVHVNKGLFAVVTFLMNRHNIKIRKLINVADNLFQKATYNQDSVRVKKSLKQDNIFLLLSGTYINRKPTFVGANWF